jgi:hypothetical protein
MQGTPTHRARIRTCRIMPGSPPSPTPLELPSLLTSRTTRARVSGDTNGSGGGSILPLTKTDEAEPVTIRGCDGDWDWDVVLSLSSS